MSKSYLGDGVYAQVTKWIDAASYVDLLRRWRCSPAGDPIFVGKAGEYYSEVLRKRRGEDPAAHVAASKEIG